MFHSTNGPTVSNAQQEISSSLSFVSVNGGSIINSSNFSNSMGVQSLTNTINAVNSTKNNQQLQQLLSMSSSPNMSNNLVISSGASSLNQPGHLITQVANPQLSALVSTGNRMTMSGSAVQMLPMQNISSGQSVLQNMIGLSQSIPTNPTVLGQIATQNQQQLLQPLRARYTNPSQTTPSRLGEGVASHVAMCNTTSNGTTSSQVAAPATSVATDPDKRRLIQQQLFLLLHAHRCQQTETDAGILNGREACKLSHCKTMRNVLNHMGNCSEGKNCQIPHCASSRQILNHWKNCTSKDCPVCQPLKAQNQRNQGVTPHKTSVAGVTIPQSVVPRQMMNGSLTVNYNQSPSQNRQVCMPMGSLQMPSPGGSFSSSGASPGGNSNISGQVQFSAIPTSNSIINGSNALNEQLTVPVQLKDWHNQVTNEMRQHLVRRIVQTIFPAPDPSAYRDPRMNNLIEYAKKVEKDMYNVANGKEEYFHLLAEKCYKIHKELEEKRRSRQAVGGVPNNVVSFGNLNTQITSLQGGSSDLNTMGPPSTPLVPSNIPIGSRPIVGVAGAAVGCQSPSMNRSGADPYSIMPMTPGPISQVSQGGFSNSTANDASLNAAQQETEKLFNKALQTEYRRQDSSLDSSQLSVTCSNGVLEQGCDDTSFVVSNNHNTNSQDLLIATDSIKLEIKSETSQHSDTNAVGCLIKKDGDSCNINLLVKCEVKSEPFETSTGVTTLTSNPNGIVQMKSSSAIHLSATSNTLSSNLPKPSAGPRNLRKWSREDLIRAFFPVYEKLYKAEPDSVPFQKPVDPIALSIPDYKDIVKTPMDLSTIRSKLDQGVYKDPWEATDDFHLMFNNAWTYNKKTSRVYKMCTKLNETFVVEIDKVMQKLGFCCGQECVFEPQGLYCFSPSVCVIPRDVTYYCYKTKEKGRLVCDRYIYCENCYNKSENFIDITEDTGQSPVSIPKAEFEKLKNNIKEHELFVHCKECGRKFHKICALHMNEIWPSGYTCKHCLNELGLKRKENKYTAKRLPCNKLSSYLERRVNDYLRKKEAGAGEVVIRVLASSDKVCEVKAGMRARYTETGEMPESFPYRAKAIFAFENIDGQDVCFFGLHVQEYGSECPAPNTRRVYVSYLDSVHFFQPKQFRTDVYHEILIGYLDYVKKLGYTQAHIWACPPSEGDDYIFHCHPSDQKLPKPKRLQDWYKKMLDKALMERIVIDYKDVLRYALENNMTSPTEIAYFEGDFWPGSLEESIKEIEAEEQKRRSEEEALAAQAAQDEADDDVEIEVEVQPIDGGNVPSKHGSKLLPKKASKRKAKKNAASSNKRKKLSAIPHAGEGNQLSAKFYETMEKHKEVFFVIRLHSHGNSANLERIQDPDPLVQCDLMDGRDNLLCLARDKHLEFSSLRRCKYSSLHILYELHTEGQGSSFTFNCDHCNAQIETRYHCQECEDFDLCTKCYNAKVHPHRMEKLGFGLDEGASEDGASNPQESKRVSIERCIKSLVHACQCRDANCRIHTCIKMKRVLCHTKNCNKKTNNSCSLCKQLIALCCYHAKFCQEARCNVPFCQNIKYRLRQQHLQQRFQQAQMLRRRMNTMQRGMAVPVSSTSASAQVMPVQPQPGMVVVSSTTSASAGISNSSAYTQMPLYQSGTNQCSIDAALRAQSQPSVQQQQQQRYPASLQVPLTVQNQIRPSGGIIPAGQWQSSTSVMQRMSSPQSVTTAIAAQQRHDQNQISNIIASLTNNLRNAKTPEEYAKLQSIIEQVRTNPQLALARVQQARTAQQAQAQAAVQMQQPILGQWNGINRFPVQQSGVRASQVHVETPQHQLFQHQQQNQRLQASHSVSNSVAAQQSRLQQRGPSGNVDSHQMTLTQLPGVRSGSMSIGGQCIVSQPGVVNINDNSSHSVVLQQPEPSTIMTSADKLANFVDKL